MSNLELAKEVERIVLESGYSIKEGIELIKKYYSCCNKNNTQDNMVE